MIIGEASVSELEKIWQTNSKIRTGFRKNYESSQLDKVEEILHKAFTSSKGVTLIDYGIGKKTEIEINDPYVLFDSISENLYILNLLPDSIKSLVNKAALYNTGYGDSQEEEMFSDYVYDILDEICTVFDEMLQKESDAFLFEMFLDYQSNFDHLEYDPETFEAFEVTKVSYR